MPQEKLFKEITGTPVIILEKDGDSIQGLFVEAQNGQYGDNYVVNVNGEEKLLFGNTVLRTKLGKIKKGQEIRVTKLKDEKSKEGRLYGNFKVEVAQ